MEVDDLARCGYYLIVLYSMRIRFFRSNGFDSALRFDGPLASGPAAHQCNTDIFLFRDLPSKPNAKDRWLAGQ